MSRVNDMLAGASQTSQRRFLTDLVNDLGDLKKMAINAVMTSGAIAIATTASKVKTTATVTYRIDGVLKSKGATDNLWTLAGATVADGKYQKYLLLLDASAAASVAEGQPGDTSAKVVLPAIPDSKAIVGIVEIVTVGAAFIPGTTLLSATEVTDTYTDGFDPSNVAGRVLA